MSVNRELMRKPVTMLPARYRTGFPWQLDKRCRTSRELAADMLRLWSDLGGVESLSSQQLILVERLAFMRQRLIQHEQAVLNDREPPMGPNEYTAAVNTLLGLLKAIGLQRQAKDVGSLQSYLAASAAEPDEAPQDLEPEVDDVADGVLEGTDADNS